MQKGLAGELFGVNIYLPISRIEVKALIQAKNALAEYLVRDKYKSLYEVHLQLDRQIHVFAHRLEREEASRFYRFFLEEVTNSNSKKLELNPNYTFSEVIPSYGVEFKDRYNIRVDSLLKNYLGCILSSLICIIFLLYSAIVNFNL
ncbi:MULTISPECIES: hypothetical protein [Acinetobacter]|uniref:hypothetical protein n=1 Tax=Acinetobacter TaxID=469 RepID=UPI000E70BF94|nr:MULTISPECIES: hypothetical protein [Acinetobacter]RJL71956.1 hypothetical protein D5055_07020 [Acinetobacter radioresistens]